MANSNNSEDVTCLLGLTRYYYCFIYGYTGVVAPMKDLLQKDAFTWSEVELTNSVELKNAIVQVVVLNFPDFSKMFMVETNALFPIIFRDGGSWL